MTITMCVLRTTNDHTMRARGEAVADDWSPWKNSASLAEFVGMTSAANTIISGTGTPVEVVPKDHLLCHARAVGWVQLNRTYNTKSLVIFRMFIMSDKRRLNDTTHEHDAHICAASDQCCG